MNKLVLVLAAFFLVAVGWKMAPTAAPAAPVKTEKSTAASKASGKERKIVVSDGAHQVVYVLNGSPAAEDLFQQLPLTIELQNYSDNEKIFYPRALNVKDTPRAKNQAGTLAYYAPWKDVVLFYGPYRENEELYELGHVLDGEEQIPQLQPGNVTIQKK
ncbi:cyclophilin-like fold protein [Acidaminococcus timonensis]|uniref:cyclophilin-like fold protein n=1 Tax=Acidaminococcus timonensis TaxID=1871002 RepID=UPI00307B8D7C